MNSGALAASDPSRRWTPWRV